MFYGEALERTVLVIKTKFIFLCCCLYTAEQSLWNYSKEQCNHSHRCRCYQRAIVVYVGIGTHTMYVYMTCTHGVKHVLSFVSSRHACPAIKTELFSVLEMIQSRCNEKWESKVPMFGSSAFTSTLYQVINTYKITELIILKNLLPIIHPLHPTTLHTSISFQ